MATVQMRTRCGSSDADLAQALAWGRALAERLGEIGTRTSLRELRGRQSS
jgi:hypothetical protein